MKIRVGFGFGTIAGAGFDGETFWKIVDTLEELGWDSLWLSERVGGDLFDPLAGMAALAGRTRKLKFGPSVLVLPGRNPVLLAKELATIDVLSGGRLVAAFGLGVEDPREHALFGVPRDEAPGRTEEAVLLMKRLWSEERVTHEGRYFQVADVTVGPRPVQRPHPDVWFGGHSKAALRRVGELGEGWLPSFVMPGRYRAMADTIREIAARRERRIDEEHYGALVAYFPEGARNVDAVTALLASRRPALDPDAVVRGGDDAIRERLEEFAAEGASKFVLVPLDQPRDWQEELARLRETVVRPLEN
ncbi:MAG: hypothetical protein QOD06_37 [Candidatus Binatota bacterium]|nr:hypothetical protein [Candidatus Binatota bacterium]